MPDYVIVRDGSASHAYVGECDLSPIKLLDILQHGGAIELKNVYALMTLTIPLGPGSIAQDTNVFPLDAEIDAVKSLFLRPHSIHRPSEEGMRRLQTIINKCEANLTRMRSGLVMASPEPPTNPRGGGLLGG